MENVPAQLGGLDQAVLCPAHLILMDQVVTLLANALMMQRAIHNGAPASAYLDGKVCIVMSHAQMGQWKLFIL